MTDEYYEGWKKEYERMHNIFCPHCNERQSVDTMMEHSTFHGEKDDEDKICHCEHCDKRFIVNESVDRTFETDKCDEA